MLNYLHARLHRPEHGWDPVPAQYASEYSSRVDARFDDGLLDSIEARIGSLRGRRILDLGGGPGQYTVALARRGASVVWHDVSRAYLDIAQARAAANQVAVQFSVGYLEEAGRFRNAPFDFIFCRVCWYYCRNDRRFARLIYSLLKPGGAAYIDCNTPAFARARGLRSLQLFLNRALGIKIGHPYPPHGRIARLFHALPVDKLLADYSSEWNDRVLFVKSRR
jgi:2-polyprenyl-3-methyl-5-hydroxy-6-metoxy-1,4-benzoquinol methylase